MSNTPINTTVPFATLKPNRLSNQTDSVSYASDSTIEDSISSFDSPLIMNTSTASKAAKTSKRGRAPGKRKIKEKVDSDYYFDDSSTVSTNKSFDKKSKDNQPTTATKRKYRPKNNNVQNCLNKELLELKIEIQEKQRLLKADNNEDDDQPNLFFTNTPSTSSASESAFAENAEFGTDFHNYEERKYRDTSPHSFIDDFARSPTNSYINDSLTSTDKKKKKSSNLNKKLW